MSDDYLEAQFQRLITVGYGARAASLTDAQMRNMRNMFMAGARAFESVVLHPAKNPANPVALDRFASMSRELNVYRDRVAADQRKREQDFLREQGAFADRILAGTVN